MREVGLGATAVTRRWWYSRGEGRPSSGSWVGTEGSMMQSAVRMMVGEEGGGPMELAVERKDRTEVWLPRRCRCCPSVLTGGGLGRSMVAMMEGWERAAKAGVVAGGHKESIAACSWRVVEEEERALTGCMDRVCECVCLCLVSPLSLLCLCLSFWFALRCVALRCVSCCSSFALFEFDCAVEKN